MCIYRNGSFNLGNTNVADCRSTESVIVYGPECKDEEQEKDLKLVNVTFSNISVYENSHVLDAGSISCSRLILENVTLQGNKCSGKGCILLSAENDLKYLQLHNNRADDGHLTETSIFAATEGSRTVGHNITSERNQLRTFHIDFGTLNLTDSYFQENKVNQSFASGFI